LKWKLGFLDLAHVISHEVLIIGVYALNRTFSFFKYSQRDKEMADMIGNEDQKKLQKETPNKCLVRWSLVQSAPHP
jgi:hypothetical protein